jgi:hypothetical protein
MSLSTEERSRINRENASHSTGPKTAEGKQRSSRNALRHGLTAQILALPGENPDDIQAFQNLWITAHQPQTLDECELVDQLSLSTLCLGRLQEAGFAVVADQVRQAVPQWDRAQEIRLHDLKHLLETDPARALIELRSFGHGVRWLLARWEELKEVADAEGYWNNPGLLKDALKLYGYAFGKPSEDGSDAYLLMRMAAYAAPADEPIIDLEKLADWMPPFLRGMCLPPEQDQAEARRDLNTFLTLRIAEFEALAGAFAVVDQQSRGEAELRARMPADTGQNRLFIRYQRAAETSYERALKALTKLQAERQKADTPPNTKGLKIGLRNEANPHARPPTSGPLPRGYVWMAGGVWEYQGAVYDQIVLHEVSGVPAGMPMEVSVHLGTVEETPETAA